MEEDRDAFPVRLVLVVEVVVEVREPVFDRCSSRGRLPHDMEVDGCPRVGGTKLLLEFANAIHWIHFDPPKWMSLSLIAVTFLIAYVMARRKGPVDSDDAESLITDR